MSARKGQCVNDRRRSVGTFGGKLLCGVCRPRSDAWKQKRALKIEREEQEAARKVAAQQKLETRMAEEGTQPELEDLRGVEE